MDYKEMLGKAQRLFLEAKAILEAEDASAEDLEKAEKMLEDAKAMKARAFRLDELEKAAADITRQPPPSGDGQRPGQFKSLGAFYRAVYMNTFRGVQHPGLKAFVDPQEPSNSEHTGVDGWMENPEYAQKTLVESVGASGGYLVPVQEGETVYMMPPPAQIVRSRATIIPMRRRMIRWPTLDQTGTTSGQPHWWGGVIAKWTEEATEKEESEPTFRQINIVAHKLCCYTEAGDELLEDAAVSLEALLRTAFSGTINWQEEEAFIAGTGAGQPQGVINAPATITVTAAAANALGVADIVNMLESFMGTSPVWMASQGLLSDLMLLNGPATNPSYIFMPSAREGMPNTLFGYPLLFSEHCPRPYQTGCLILADWSKYLVGDRQATTVDSSKHYKFANDITSWRAVHRVDGQPWLKAPLTYADGTTQVSPFVQLGEYST
jgi:HK97 family phage major capsid protein